LLWVPVQLTQPPAPDLPGSLLVGSLLAAFGALVFGRLVPLPPKAPSVWRVVLVAAIWFCLSAGLAFLFERDAAFALRVGLPRSAYVLLLGLLAIWLVNRERSGN
jgi:hypothetical protein